jgi:hypothetical protein
VVRGSFRVKDRASPESLLRIVGQDLDPHGTAQAVHATDAPDDQALDLGPRLLGRAG